MSKSLGNGIDPLEIIEKYGADALRYALATGNSPGNDMRFSDEKIEAARNFANKLWNASRFVRMNLTVDSIELPSPEKLGIEDKWILTRFNNTVSEVRAALDRFDIGVALSLLNDFTWDIFCDWYIELSKAKLNDRENPANKITQNVIGYVLIGTLKLLHPFIPFITEEIYLSLPHSDESIMISKYPEYDSAIDFSSEAVKLDKIIDVTKSIRARRSEMNVAPSRKAKLFIATKYNDIFNEESAVFFTRLASASEVIISESFDSDERISLDEAVQVITDTATVYIPLSDIIDFEKEKERLNGERKKLLGEIERLEKKLSNEGFVAKAPAAVIDGEKAKLAKYRENLAGVDAAIEKLH